jgi:hypothetical protein
MPIFDQEGSELEYVQPTKTRKGYWRRRPFTHDLPSAHQRRARALFARSAYGQRGDFGKAKVVGKDGNVKELPKTTKAVQDNMKGVKISPEKPRRISDFAVADLEAIRKIAEVLREIKELGT